jgi:hypothetical protein
MLRNEYVVTGIGERDVLFRQTNPPTEFAVNKADLDPTIVADIMVGDVFSGVDRGSMNPFDLVLERKARAGQEFETDSEQVEQADFKFVPSFFAKTRQEAESYVQNAPEAMFAVIFGKTQSVANGWLVPIRLISELQTKE